MKTKHIETLCRESYTNEMVLHYYRIIQELIDTSPQKFIKTYLSAVGDMLGKDV